jgi:hypothetical protein
LLQLSPQLQGHAFGAPVKPGPGRAQIREHQERNG